MKHALEVVKVMTPFPHAIDSSLSLEDAEKKLMEHRNDLLPVTTGDFPSAILTRRDLEIAKTLRAGTEGPTLIKDLGLPAPYIVEPTEQLAAVLSRMLREKLEAALVVKKGRIVGIFTYTDAYSVLLKFLSGSFSLFSPPDISA